MYVVIVVDTLKNITQLSWQIIVWKATAVQMSKDV